MYCRVYCYSDSNKIEREQKKAFAIILGNEYTSYEKALQYLGQNKLCERRKDICLKFAKKCLKSEQHSDMFPLLDSNRPVTRQNIVYKEYQCKTSRYYNSAIPYLTRLLNEDDSIQ